MEEDLKREIERIRTVNIRFIKKVAMLRNLQKAYFKTRDKEILRQSCAIETEVDNYLAKCMEAIERMQFEDVVTSVEQIIDGKRV